MGQASQQEWGGTATSVINLLSWILLKEREFLGTLPRKQYNEIEEISLDIFSDFSVLEQKLIKLDEATPDNIVALGQPNAITGLFII